VSLVLLNACATLKQIVKEPTVTFKDVTPEQLSLTDGKFLFNFNVNNPNSLGVKLSKITYDLRVNEKDLIKDTLPEGIKVPAKGDAVMSIPVTVRYADLFNNLSDALKSDALAYDLKGTMGIGPFSIPYQHKGQLKMPKLPEISLTDVNVNKLSLNGAAIKMELKLKNPNDFDLNLSGLNYAVKLQDKEFVSGIAKNISPLSAKGETLLNLDLNISFKELGRSALAILKGAGTKYEIKGDFLVNKPDQNEVKIPFLKSGEIPLN
jgi:LEA14-like dessication related protein